MRRIPITEGAEEALFYALLAVNGVVGVQRRNDMSNRAEGRIAFEVFRIDPNDQSKAERFEAVFHAFGE